MYKTHFTRYQQRRRAYRIERAHLEYDAHDRPETYRLQDVAKGWSTWLAPAFLLQLQ